ncbi:unnamed protein product [Lactuca saligna]|uniref:Uncharacterized protein n=1 Tax=Lactuca saligna TaxID=75948 RepID=A0AA36A704_LACSI|nr:unnamed protein product [Lactuca saligna]
MDVDITTVLRRKPNVLPKESPKDIKKMKLEMIEKENWSVMFQQSAKDDSNVQKCFFSHPDKYIYSTSCLNYILGLIWQCKVNDAANEKCFSDMVR